MPAFLIFDDVEVLDFCGPFEVFSTARHPALRATAPLFRVFIVAERGDVVRCRGNLLVQPHYTIADHPPIDLLVVPGGWGTRREAQNAGLLDWIAAQDRGSTLTLSVCTGAFLLAARGLLDGKPATTHWASLDRLAEGYPADRSTPRCALCGRGAHRDVGGRLGGDRHGPLRRRASIWRGGRGRAIDARPRRGPCLCPPTRPPRSRCGRVHIAHIAAYLDRPGALRQPVEAGPMGRRGLAVEQPARGEQKRAGAD